MAFSGTCLAAFSPKLETTGELIRRCWQFSDVSSLVAYPSLRGGRTSHSSHWACLLSAGVQIQENVTVQKALGLGRSQLIIQHALCIVPWHIFILCNQNKAMCKNWLEGKCKLENGSRDLEECMSVHGRAQWKRVLPLARAVEICNS